MKRSFRDGGIIHILEGYAELAFGALRAQRKLNGEALDDEVGSLRSDISKLEGITMLPLEYSRDQR